VLTPFVFAVFVRGSAGAAPLRWAGVTVMLPGGPKAARTDACGCARLTHEAQAAPLDVVVHVHTGEISQQVFVRLPAGAGPHVVPVLI
jgi:hypothetical protein